jgi:DNA adenine methylase
MVHAVAPAGAPAPFLKWAGGKTQLLGQLAALLPPVAHRRRYHEPFLGGGALYFHLRPRRAFLQDINADLMDAYRAVASEVDALIHALEPLAACHSAARYYQARDRWNHERARLAPVERAALFIYLNKTGYNGLWRVNSRGLHNVPAGRYSRPRVFDADLLRRDAALLGSARLGASSFEHVLDHARPTDFVYLDPPYQPIAKSSFTAYAARGFGPADQKRLAEVFAELDRRGCLVMLSNSDCSATRALYRDYHLVTVRATRSINSRPSGRGPIRELVVRNYP